MLRSRPVSPSSARIWGADTGVTATARREWLVVAGGFLVLALVASIWWAIDRRPPEWDHANHLERAVQCSRDIRAGDVRGILERSSFYPPLVLCLACLLYT